MILLSVLIPWFSFLIRGKIFAGIFCLILQITLIGWIPAAIWATMSYNNEQNKKALIQMEKRIVLAQKQRR